MPNALEKAVAELKRDPTRPVEVDLDGMRVELRAVPPRSAADVFREIGPWEGETHEQILRRLEEARRTGGSGEPPQL